MRHGDYDQPQGIPSAHLPYPLTTKGKRQSHLSSLKILKFMDKYGFDLDQSIHCSTLLRAYETASIVRSVVKKNGFEVNDVQEFEDLMERSLGAAANLSTSKIESILEKDPRHNSPPRGWKSNSWYRLPFQGAESLMASGMRVAFHLQRCADDLKTGPKRLRIVVGHGASIRHAATCLGLLKTDELPKLSMNHASPLILNRDQNGQWFLCAGRWKVRP